jgi:hypothetical protein
LTLKRPGRTSKVKFRIDSGERLARGADAKTANQPELKTPEDKNWQAASDNFIKTGAATAFMLCQEYIGGLADRTDYLEYLRRQYGFAGSLANTAFVLWNASSTARSLLTAANSYVNSSFDNYEQYKYFKPTDEAVLDVAKQAQSRLRDYYLTTNEDTDNTSKAHNVPQNLAEALWAMHNIEHQCTHAGIKALIDKTVQGATLQVKTGTLSVAPAH